jgi:hypothetical protein
MNTEGPAPAPAPFSSWTGEIAWWRFGLLSALAVVAHVSVVRLTGVEIRPLAVLAWLAAGAVVGVMLGRWDAKRYRQPRRTDRMGGPGAGVVMAGLSGLGLILAQVLSDDVMRHLPLFLAALGAVGASGAWMRDRTRSVDLARGSGAT